MWTLSNSSCGCVGPTMVGSYDRRRKVRQIARMRVHQTITNAQKQPIVVNPRSSAILLTVVVSVVFIQCMSTSEPFHTILALKRFFSIVYSEMQFEIPSIEESFAAM